VDIHVCIQIVVVSKNTETCIHPYISIPVYTHIYIHIYPAWIYKCVYKLQYYICVYTSCSIFDGHPHCPNLICHILKYLCAHMIVCLVLLAGIFRVKKKIPLLLVVVPIVRILSVAS